MTSGAKERPRLVTGGYGQHRTQWVKGQVINRVLSFGSGHKLGHIINWVGGRVASWFYPGSSAGQGHCVVFLGKIDT